jgi:hypothetical protein
MVDSLCKGHARAPVWVKIETGRRIPSNTKTDENENLKDRSKALEVFQND